MASIPDILCLAVVIGLFVVVVGPYKQRIQASERLEKENEE